MKILSFDVGIKNLAYCYMNYENSLIDIIEWDVIDLCREKHWICKHLKKKDKSVCNKQAKYYKNNKYYCKTHAKKNDTFFSSSLGQIIKDTDDNKLPLSSTMNNQRSDIIGNFEFTPSENFKINYNFSSQYIGYWL